LAREIFLGRPGFRKHQGRATDVFGKEGTPKNIKDRLYQKHRLRAVDVF
jgi:hypothetical protein